MGVGFLFFFEEKWQINNDKISIIGIKIARIKVVFEDADGFGAINYKLKVEFHFKKSLPMVVTWEIVFVFILQKFWIVFSK